MAAQRLGSILTNVTGTSNQILRVNTAETGFEFVSPASLPTYTVSNDTTDRTINANDVTMDKVADVLSTLIKDMASIYSGAGGISAFTWSTSEQVWPFEKDVSGNTLYCKEVDMGAMPNNGSKAVAHNISGLSGNLGRIVSVMGRMYNSSYSVGFYGACYVWISGGTTYYVNLDVSSTNITLYDNSNVSAYNCAIRLIYSK